MHSTENKIWQLFLFSFNHSWDLIQRICEPWKLARRCFSKTILWKVNSSRWFSFKQYKYPNNKLKGLSIVSYNCRGIKNPIVDIKKLCEAYEIIFLQETWITKQNLDFLSIISDHHYSFGYSSIDECDELRKGRPCGGTAILWKKELSAKRSVSHSGSITGLNVSCDKGNF